MLGIYDEKTTNATGQSSEKKLQYVAEWIYQSNGQWLLEYCYIAIIIEKENMNNSLCCLGRASIFTGMFDDRLRWKIACPRLSAIFLPGCALRTTAFNFRNENQYDKLAVVLLTCGSRSGSRSPFVISRAA